MYVLYIVIVIKKVIININNKFNSIWNVDIKFHSNVIYVQLIPGTYNYIFYTTGDKVNKLIIGNCLIISQEICVDCFYLQP